MVKEIIKKSRLTGNLNGGKKTWHCYVTIRKDQPYIEVEYCFFDRFKIKDEDHLNKIKPKIFQIKPEDLGIQPIDKIFEELDKIDYPKEEKQYNIEGVTCYDRQQWELYVDGVYLHGYDEKVEVFAKFNELIKYSQIYDYVKAEYLKEYYPEN